MTTFQQIDKNTVLLLHNGREWARIFYSGEWLFTVTKKPADVRICYETMEAITSIMEELNGK